MTKEQLEKQLETLAKEAYANEHKAVAGIIYSLLGAFASGNENALLAHISAFSENEIKRLTAANN